MTEAPTPSGAGDKLVREYKVDNKFGIHARPAAMFVKTCSRYDANVSVEKEGNQVSGKSIMGLMTLEASRGCILRITADGVDAKALMDDLAVLIESKFYED
ncbi:MAG: HPr family phosphocarrier protein [Verrucomicrobia bacterium]|nr:HPr family phosphocarrier protein [Verrucomicrobiota bacterium]MDA1087595.1 HPr family phosphocarrier protein [Verrucomicrobiota bacterium]